MKKTISLVGMTFSKREFPILKTENPSGSVTFVRNTQWDKKEVDTYPETGRGVMVTTDDGVRVGWVANLSGDQAVINKMIDAVMKVDPDGVIHAEISECDFLTKIPWCKVSFECEFKTTEAKPEPKAPASDDGHFAFYEKDGKKYQRLSHVVERAVLEADTSVLDNWKLGKFNSVREYDSYMRQLADAGTVMHSALEVASKAGAIDATTQDETDAVVAAIPNESFQYIPNGFWNFCRDECQGMKMLNAETTVYDDENLIAGTYDLLAEQDGKKILIDWKSSKKVYHVHKVKTAWYAFRAGADESWVVAWGSKNKSGYQLKKTKTPGALKAANDIVVAANRMILACNAFGKGI